MTQLLKDLINELLMGQQFSIFYIFVILEISYSPMNQQIYIKLPDL